MKQVSTFLKKRFAIVGLVFVISLLTVMPASIKSYYPDVFFINALKDASVNLGLDLKGGTRLEYNIDLRGVAQETKNQIITGVRSVLEKRVNNIGVSEPTIYESNVGNETHMIVELAGVDIEQAKAVVGKVIQLEFKEENPNPGNLEEENMQKKAQTVLSKVVQNPDKFAEVGGQEFIKDSIEYARKTAYNDEINESFRDKLWNAKIGEVLPQVYQASGEYELVGGQLVQKKGLYILKKLEEKTDLRKVPKNSKAFDTYKSEGVTYIKNENQNTKVLSSKLATTIDKMTTNEISDVLEVSSDKYVILKLLSKEDKDKQMYKLKQIFLPKEKLKETVVIKDDMTAAAKAKAEADNTRIQKENEAIIAKNKDLKTKLENIRSEISDGKATFEDKAKSDSQDVVSKSLGGSMGYVAEGKFDSFFDAQVFTLKNGDLSEVIESDDGYRIVKVEDIKANGEVVATYEQLEFPTDESATNVLNDLRKEKQIVYEEIFFSTSPSPWKIATGKDGTPLTGQFFKKADVEFNQNSFEPVVSITFNDKGAQLFEEITERNTGKSVAIFVGGQLISAPRVNEKITGGNAVISGSFTPKDAADLARDLNTGAIPAPITLVGQEQVGATIGLASFQSSLSAGLMGIILIFIFMALAYRISGLIAGVCLVFYGLLLYAVIQLVPGYTLTLAGVAGLILSLGLAIDANVLVYERFRDEIKSGESFGNIIEKGFSKAKMAIYASNLSSFFTSLILFIFGSSIIKGFALSLMIGIGASLFSCLYLPYTIFRLYETKWNIHKWFV